MFWITFSVKSERAKWIKQRKIVGFLAKAEVLVEWELCLEFFMKS